MKIKVVEGGATQKIKTEDDLRRIVAEADAARRPAAEAMGPTRDREPEPTRSSGGSTSYAAAAAPATESEK